MRLPDPSAHYSHVVDYGRYVGRRVRRKGYATMAADIEKCTAAVLVTGRAWDDSAGPIQDALADRDAADDDLDDVADEARANLAGRSATAVKEPPYTLIFPHGVTYYTAAPLDEELRRYGELRARVEDNLPATDAVRVKAVPAIDAGAQEFDAAVKVLDGARTAQALARTKLEAARNAWDRQMEKVYGAVVAEVGKAKAERFFPKLKGKKPTRP